MARSNKQEIWCLHEKALSNRCLVFFSPPADIGTYFIFIEHYCTDSSEKGVRYDM